MSSRHCAKYASPIIEKQVTKVFPIVSVFIQSCSQGSARAISQFLFNVSLHIKHFGLMNKREWKISVHIDLLLGISIFLELFVSIWMLLGHPLPLYCSFLILFMSMPFFRNRYVVASIVCCEEHVSPIIITLWFFFSTIFRMPLDWQGKQKHAKSPFISFICFLIKSIKSISWYIDPLIS